MALQTALEQDVQSPQTLVNLSNHEGRFQHNHEQTFQSVKKYIFDTITIKISKYQTNQKSIIRQAWRFLRHLKLFNPKLRNYISRKQQQQKGLTKQMKQNEIGLMERNLTNQGKKTYLWRQNVQDRNLVLKLITRSHISEDNLISWLESFVITVVSTGKHYLNFKENISHFIKRNKFNSSSNLDAETAENPHTPLRLSAKIFCSSFRLLPLLGNLKRTAVFKCPQIGSSLEQLLLSSVSFSLN